MGPLAGETYLFFLLVVVADAPSAFVSVCFREKILHSPLLLVAVVAPFSTESLVCKYNKERGVDTTTTARNFEIFVDVRCRRVTRRSGALLRQPSTANSVFALVYDNRYSS